MSDRPDDPIIGDVRLLQELPANGDLHRVFQFEVWDGQAWRTAGEARDTKFAVQMRDAAREMH
jgi:hypothetical protein